MVDMSKYGYRSAAAFLKDRNVSRQTFGLIAGQNWYIAKRVLKHPDCPIDIRDRFRQSSVWYERITAIFAGKTPVSYRQHAVLDPDKRVRAFYWKQIRQRVHVVIDLLFKLGMDV